jgi:ribosomal-protein-alanine N-acetyltransferase
MLADLDEVMQIEPLAFGNHHWSRQSFINELNNPSGRYYAVCIGKEKKLVGYTGFWLIGEEAHITTLAVHPSQRRRYVGERLLIHVIHEAGKLGAKWLTLEVRVTNETAQQLYFKYGFKSLGMRQSYYQDNSEDALVLWSDNIETPEFKELLKKRMNHIRALTMMSDTGTFSLEELRKREAQEKAAESSGEGRKSADDQDEFWR